MLNDSIQSEIWWQRCDGTPIEEAVLRVKEQFFRPHLWLYAFCANEAKIIYEEMQANRRKTH